MFLFCNLMREYPFISRGGLGVPILIAAFGVVFGSNPVPKSSGCLLVKESANWDP